MATFIGIILAFDTTLEDWPTYVERAEQFMKANKVKDEDLVPTLLTLMGRPTYSLLRNLVGPQKPPEMCYTDIMTTLTKHLTPKHLVIAERFRFHKRNQGAGETINTYVATLRKLARTCEFESQLDDAIRDQLVCGLSSAAI